LNICSSGCGISFKKVGCFKDSNKHRAMSKLLLTGRDATSPDFEGRVDWKNYIEYIKG